MRISAREKNEIRRKKNERRNNQIKRQHWIKGEKNVFSANSTSGNDVEVMGKLNRLKNKTHDDDDERPNSSSTKLRV